MWLRGVIGGMIGDGVPLALAGELTALSAAGAGVGALLFCLAVRGPVSDTEA